MILVSVLRQFACADWLFHLTVLTTDLDLCGGFLTWLTRERRDYLNGRYISVHWDVDELEAKKDEIVKGDKLKFKMVL